MSNSNEIRDIICTCCPLGCNLSISKSDDDYIVTGNKCPRGKKYAIEEVTAPQRMVTSTVKISGGLYPMLPVKTDKPIPKEKVFTIMEILAKVDIQVPVNMEDVIVENVIGTGANIVATKTDRGKKLGRDVREAEGA